VGEDERAQSLESDARVSSAAVESHSVFAGDAHETFGQRTPGIPEGTELGLRGTWVAAGEVTDQADEAGAVEAGLEAQRGVGERPGLVEELAVVVLAQQREVVDGGLVALGQRGRWRGARVVELREVSVNLQK
jgi:hypothetical protein